MGQIGGVDRLLPHHPRRLLQHAFVDVPEPELRIVPNREQAPSGVEGFRTCS